MKPSVSFSGNETEPTSLNFTELRNKGLDYIQELSGDEWTDYNSHDPGVTILEQICYALTDIALRTSLPVEDLLTPGEGLSVVPKNNAFFTPSTILSSHPVTEDDTRKMIFDQFDEIQNVWIISNEKTGYEEQLDGINQIEILPSFKFLNSIKSHPKEKKIFLNKVNNFLSENRNLGERYEEAILLEPQDINIKFNIYLDDQANLEITIAKLFLKLLEFVYSRIQYYSYHEMTEAGFGMEETFSGPRLNNGFIKNEFLNPRITSLYIDELQKLFIKIDGISRCEVKPFIINGKECKFLEAEKNKFFHLLVDGHTRTSVDHRFDRIYDNMSVFINNQKLHVLDRLNINNLFSETWSKKHREYRIGKSLNEFFYSKLKGTYRKPDEYYSIQRHFPIIYGIGEEGLSQKEPLERRAKAMQLKAYLMFFEQHLANHLAQLGNLNEFFNIDFKKGQKKTYFAQWMHSVPEINKLTKENIPAIESYLESESIFFSRKNKIYNHMLARFGEDLNDLPWKVSLRLNLIRNEKELNRILLQKKSEFLLNLKKLSYYRSRGESFHPVNSEDKDPKSLDEDQKSFRNPSGLEQMILAKTGIPSRKSRSQIPDFTGLKKILQKVKEDQLNDNEELNKKYRHLKTSEIDHYTQLTNEGLPNASFGEIGLKTLFKETLDYKNYRLSKPKLPSDKVQVIFQKEKNKWVSLFESPTEKIAIQKICQIVSFFITQNKKSERLYIVDHILLDDILVGSKYGFCFFDEYGEPLFQTFEEESWCESEEDRYAQLENFYKFGELYDSYSDNNGKWMIKDDKGKIIVTYQANNHNPVFGKDDLIKQTKSLIKLFNSSENTSGRLRFEEMEKIRLKGSQDDKDYGQRRLVFQRKVPNKIVDQKKLSYEIIGEDFFNLNISVVLPDWPARFQDERFQDYVTNIIHERIPAHIDNEILWVKADHFKAFEEKYLAWENLKSESGNSKANSLSMKSAALEVYQQLMKIKNK